MSETGELALHPPKLGGVFERLLLGLGDVDLLQHAVIVGARGEAGFGRYVVVDLPDPLRAVDRRVESNVGIAVPGGQTIVSGLMTPGIQTRGCGFCRGTAHGLTTRCW